MTPKEKAKELGEKAIKILGVYNYHIDDDAKDIALLCVNEILNGSRLFYIEDYDYWKKVKGEIGLL